MSFEIAVDTALLSDNEIILNAFLLAKAVARYQLRLLEIRVLRSYPSQKKLLR